MTRYMTIAQYADYSGLPPDLIRRLLRCYLADRFSFRASGARNAPYYINAEKLDRMLDDQELKEVLEG